MLRDLKTYGTARVAAAFAAFALGAAHAAAESRDVAGYANCGITLGMSAAQLKAAEPKTLWLRGRDEAAKRNVPIAVLGRDRDGRPTDEKRMLRIFFTDASDAGKAYRVWCRQRFVDGEIARGVDALRAIVERYGPPAESYNGDRPVPFALPARAGSGFPLAYYWGGTRAEQRADAAKPILLVQIWKDGMDRDVFEFRFQLNDARLRR